MKNMLNSYILKGVSPLEKLKDKIKQNGWASEKTKEEVDNKMFDQYKKIEKFLDNENI